MLARLGVEIVDLGVVRDDPAKLEAHSGKLHRPMPSLPPAVSVGEADFIKQMMAKLGEVLFWKIAMRPGRPMAFSRSEIPTCSACRNPVAVMVTFYAFVRDALLHRRQDGRSFSAPAGEIFVPLRKVQDAPNTSAASCNRKAANGGALPASGARGAALDVGRTASLSSSTHAATCRRASGAGAAHGGVA
jgi:hypothetical protein